MRIEVDINGKVTEHENAMVIDRPVEETINQQIQKAKQYINDTGWIWEKYNRNVLVLKDLTDEAFYIKYSEIITKQEEYRVLINELEVQLEVING